MTRDEVKAVAAVIKKRFTNLSVEETIDLASEILEALDRIRSS